MQFPWLARPYERICADCGSSWLVPREFARKRVLSVAGATSGPHVRYRGRYGSTTGPAAADIQAAGTMAGQAATLRVCPKCGSEHSSRHPVRSRTA